MFVDCALVVTLLKSGDGMKVHALLSMAVARVMCFNRQWRTGFATKYEHAVVYHLQF